LLKGHNELAKYSGSSSILGQPKAVTYAREPLSIQNKISSLQNQEATILVELQQVVNRFEFTNNQDPSATEELDALGTNLGALQTSHKTMQYLSVTKQSNDPYESLNGKIAWLEQLDRCQDMTPELKTLFISAHDTYLTTAEEFLTTLAEESAKQPGTSPDLPKFEPMSFDKKDANDNFQTLADKISDLAQTISKYDQKIPDVDKKFDGELEKLLELGERLQSLQDAMPDTTTPQMSK